MTKSARKIGVGARLGSDLTVLGIVDDRGDEPVYLVWHHRSWCPMLCKVLQSMETAQREADILLALAHPNIVRCFGRHGSTGLLMEYLEGPNLHQLLKSRPKRRLRIDDALRISIYVGAALAHVHDRGLMHLDVKPSNIVVVKGRPILCDFGIARWQVAPRPGGVRGTEGYTAPEECKLEEITPAADIFSLGVTLYELLTGKLPFPAKGDAEAYPQVRSGARTVRRLVMRNSNLALWLQPLLLEEARKLADSQGVALNLNVAVAEKLSALRTETISANVPRGAIFRRPYVLRHCHGREINRLLNVSVRRLHASGVAERKASPDALHPTFSRYVGAGSLDLLNQRERLAQQVPTIAGVP